MIREKKKDIEINEYFNKYILDLLKIYKYL